MSLSARRALNAYYAMVCERLCLADAIMPNEQGQRSRLQAFHEELDAPLPGGAGWGTDEDTVSQLEALLAGGG
jgi:hypothetical protein